MTIPEKYLQLVTDAAQSDNLRVELLGAMLQHESDWNPDAVGDNGLAHGLGQMHPTACETIGMDPNDRFDPTKAIPGAAKYLAFCIKHCGGDERLGLMAYNRGPTDIVAGIAYANAVMALVQSDV